MFDGWLGEDLIKGLNMKVILGLKIVMKGKERVMTQN